MLLVRRKSAVAVVSGLTVTALVLTGCGGADAPPSADNPLELTVTTFGTFGYDDLYAEYEAANPHITINATNVDSSGNARTDVYTKLAAGSGLSDVVAIEEGWLGSIMDVSDSFVDLNDHGAADIADNWVDWKFEQGTDAEGRVIGYGTDIGPQGLCYNGALLEEAGMDSDREAVAEMLGGDGATWEQYFDAGREYHEATGKPWYDQSSFIWNSMVNQMEEGYYTADGELNVEDNAALRENFMLLAAATGDGLSADQEAHDWGNGQAFVDGSFATLVCPGWMLGKVREQLESAGGGPESGWDFADVFPGGAANWGGAFLAVPQTSEHQEEAAALAAWLTHPDQQITVSETVGNFPSTIEAQEYVAEQATPNEMLNDAPTGTILASRAEGVVAQFKGPDDSVIQENVFRPALQLLDDETATADEAWDEAMRLFDELIDEN